MKNLLITIAFSFLFLCFHPLLAENEESGNDYVSIKFISDRDKVEPGKPFRIGILMTMEDKWHTYWKNPGNTGMPTNINFHNPKGFNCTDFKWPQPEIFVDGDLVNYGYKNTVLFISYVYPQKSLKIGESYQFKANLSWLVCKEKCLPGADSISFEIKTANNEEVNASHLVIFDKFEEMLPLEEGWAFSAKMEDEKIILNANKYLAHGINMKEVIFYPINEGIIDLTAEQQYIPSTLEFDLVLKLDKFRYEDPKRLSGILISQDGWIDGKSSKSILVDNIRIK